MNKGNLNAALRDLARGAMFVDVVDMGERRSRVLRLQAEFADRQAVIKHQADRRLARKSMGRI